jgi:hypothetical protein
MCWSAWLGNSAARRVGSNHIARRWGNSYDEHRLGLDEIGKFG